MAEIEARDAEKGKTTADAFAFNKVSMLLRKRQFPFVRAHKETQRIKKQVAEHQTKVQNSRARILRNDVQIQNLLESVMASK